MRREGMLRAGLLLALHVCLGRGAAGACAPGCGGAPRERSLQGLMRLRGGAEVGKGDPRWIVQDREDGKNVGSWHWEERDMMIWTREQLPAFALGARGEMADFEGWSGHYEVTNVTAITGDCVIHLRKGKLWPLADLNVAMAIKGVCEKKDEKSVPITGSITFPEVTMDDRDDLQVRATTGAGGAASEAFGRWLRKEGYKAAEEAVQKYLDALNAKAGQEKPPEDDAEKMRQALLAAEKMAQVNKVVADNIPTPADDFEDKGPPTGKLELQEDFICSAQDVYDCLTIAARINAYTRCSDSSVELRVGGRFSTFGGQITGGFEELAHGGHIRCKWRMGDWKPGQFSNVRVDIHDRGAGEGCQLILVQDAIPSKCVEAVDRHWKERIFNGIKRTFGYGNLNAGSLLR